MKKAGVTKKVDVVRNTGALVMGAVSCLSLRYVVARLLMVFIYEFVHQIGLVGRNGDYMYFLNLPHFNLV